jgi:hypothetical protein
MLVKAIKEAVKYKKYLLEIRKIKLSAILSIDESTKLVNFLFL